MPVIARDEVGERGWGVSKGVGDGRPVPHRPGAVASHVQVYQSGERLEEVGPQPASVRSECELSDSRKVGAQGVAQGSYGV